MKTLACWPLGFLYINYRHLVSLRNLGKFKGFVSGAVNEHRQWIQNVGRNLAVYNMLICWYGGCRRQKRITTWAVNRGRRCGRKHGCSGATAVTACVQEFLSPEGGNDVQPVVTVSGIKARSIDMIVAGAAEQNRAGRVATMVTRLASTAACCVCNLGIIVSASVSGSPTDGDLSAASGPGVASKMSVRRWPAPRQWCRQHNHRQSDSAARLYGLSSM